MSEYQNDWELPVNTSEIKVTKNYNLEDIYDHTHSELSLQQSKRDQIITLYLALVSFSVPFALSSDVIAWKVKGMIFLMLGLIGLLFTLVCVRYREYKEIYWLSCQALTVLMNFDKETIDKLVVQRTFFRSLRKKGKGYFDKKKGRLTYSRFIKKNLFSAETMHYSITMLMTSFIFGFGVGIIAMEGFPIVVGVLAGLLVFFYLSFMYFRSGWKIYGILNIPATEQTKDEKNARFNSVFSKAWTLHFYYSE